MSTIAEIGPGFSAKVGFGLAELGFQGSIFLIEPNRLARSWAEHKYRSLLPGADVRTIPFSVPEVGSLDKIAVDLLLANHILDDLLLNAYVRCPDIDQIFSGMHPDAQCSEIFIKTWHQLYDTTEAITKLINDVVDGLVGYVNAIEPACLILNEYASWRHNQCGLDVIHEVSLRAMRRLQGRLEHDRPAGQPPTLTRSGPMFWLVCECRPTQRPRAADVECRIVPMNAALVQPRRRPARS